MAGEPVRCSVVIPVFRSAPFVGRTLDAVHAALDAAGCAHEIVAVNDGSGDGSWDVLRERTRSDPRLVAVDLARNAGQHAALLCGLGWARGAYAATVDDDLQNPPEEIPRLLARAEEGGFDVVFARFRAKRHPGWRRAGSALVGGLNRWWFGRPRDLAVSNFRLIRRDVVGRILASRPRHPYLTGLALRFCERPGNAWVEHRPRAGGRSRYGPRRLLALVVRIALCRFDRRPAAREPFEVREALPPGGPRGPLRGGAGSV
jgi:glycosyltransferase involved in cell wall biosynthesis